ncbi:uncharacterized protein UHO2_00211 [Ustilago hordei]|uniref:Uncharacterized protein n=1 Tax=Ustilago hordei TaxID=120017 RepID=I2FXU5_USTHO|nr:uncharacterized protein UHO2_00211 [Ustilago hordei]CCF51738.1 uncharacterized protein UHOR_03744 [Ustilago hordei]SYW81707.1 uncharacterized protein UHO2_00211 [Ustilago hordei]
MTEEEEEAAIPISFFVSSLLFFFPCAAAKLYNAKLGESRQANPSQSNPHAGLATAKPIGQGLSVRHFEIASASITASLPPSHQEKNQPYSTSHSTSYSTSNDDKNTDTTQHIRYCTTTIEMQGQGEDEVIITMKHSQVWVPLDLQTMYLSKSNVQDADTWMRWKLAKDQQG